MKYIQVIQTGKPTIIVQSLKKIASISVILGKRGPAGTAGGTLQDVNTFDTPMVISSSIPAPTGQNTRTFVKGPAVNPTITDGINGQRQTFVGTDDVNPVEIMSGSNILLSGMAVLKRGSMLTIDYIAGLGWLEVGRNEI